MVKYLLFKKSILNIILVMALKTISIIGMTQPIHCKLVGTTIGRNSVEIKLAKATEDARFSGVVIPIINNRFEYTFTVQYSEKYNLIFKDELDNGAWYSIGFFPENGSVNFSLYSLDSASKDKVTGGNLNMKMNRFNLQQQELFNPLFKPVNDSINVLYRLNKFYSEKKQLLQKRLNQSDDKYENMKLYNELEDLQEKGEYYSPEGSILVNELDSIKRMATRWQNDYIRSNIDIFSYSLICSELTEYPDNKKTIDLGFITAIYPQFARKFPSHPYTKTIGGMLDAINKAKVGNPFIDFTAPTLDGKEVRISEEITGKVALLDFWASWCLPCRALSKKMIPVYEKFKGKGFVIIGIACEYKDSKAMQGAITTDKYPWLNLIELDNKNGIWSLYGISGAGGSTFLIDAKGKIVAIHPDADQLEKKLEDMLGKE